MPDEILRIDVRPEQHRVVLALSGELDHFSATSVRDAVRALAGGGLDDVVIDLRGLDFMDSGGIHLLQDLRDGRNGPLRFQMVDGVEAVRRPLHMVGEERVLPAAEAVGPP